MSDLHDSRQAGALEITPAMIEAGSSVLRGHGLETLDGARVAAEDVLLACLGPLAFLQGRGS